MPQNTNSMEIVLNARQTNLLAKVLLLFVIVCVSGLFTLSSNGQTTQIVPITEDSTQSNIKQKKIAVRQGKMLEQKVEEVSELQAKSQLLTTTGAARNLPGFLVNTLPRNDDGSTSAVTLPFAINYFGVNFTQTYVNNNGNITFTGPLSTFTPFGLVNTNTPIIAPYFADVDTRNTTSGVVTYGVDTVNGRQAFGVNYFNVGYYSSNADKLNTFQLILINRSDTGAGNFDIEFNYEQIQWETGDASSGTGGLGGSPARVGYANGTTQPGASYEQPGSAVTLALLDSNAQTGLTRNSLNSNGQIGRYVFPVRTGTVSTAPHQYDFNGDNRDDLGFFRPSATTDPDFYILNSAGGFLGYNWGGPGDISVIADYDADSKADIAVWRPSNGTWYVIRSANSTVGIQQHGATGDIPVPADYDGDGRADYAYWRAGAAATISILQSSNNTTRTELFGQTGDVPLAGNFDGDNKADPAVYRNAAIGSQCYFYFRGSLGNPSGATTYIPWGTTGDIQVAADYDGDGKVDPSVFRPSTREWLIKQTATGQSTGRIFGLPTDLLVPGDYDGDNKADIAIFRDGVWWINQSSNGVVRIQQYGITGDKPIQLGNLR